MHITLKEVVEKQETGLTAKNKRICKNAAIIKSIYNFFVRACTTKTDTTMKGTCYTQSECTTKGGTSGGACASGTMLSLAPSAQFL